MAKYSSLGTLDVAALALALEAERASARAETGTAVSLYLDALEAQHRFNGEMHHALVGRLAMMYRRCGRYDEEVALLRRYQEVHDSGPSPTRFYARMSKAVTLAERARRSETGALQSVRQAVTAVHQQRRPRAANPSATPKAGPSA